MYDINNLFLFSSLADGESEKIVAALPPAVTFSRGEEILSPPGERALGVFLSGTGDAENGDVVKVLFGEGSVFGAASLFGGDEPVSRIVARTECTVRFIPEETVRTLVLTRPECAENYVRFLSDKVRYLNRKIKEYTGNSSADCLLRYLRGNAKDGRVYAANMAELARLTGMGRTSLYRALDELQRKGTALRDGSYIILKE